MIDVQLFINGIKASLFKDEGLQINDTIQDAKDIGAIYTTFSQSFTLPADVINNDIFKNYYNANIVDGFDGRIKTPATIKVNGFDRYFGYIELQDVRLKDNRPTQYKVFFTGLTSELKDIIKDDRLSDLADLSQYNIGFNQTNIEKGFEDFISATGTGTTTIDANVEDCDLCVPFITHTSRYVYTTALFEVDEDGTISTRHLNFRELKPALRLKRIVEAIENEYNISFSSDFIDNDTLFNRLFMWLHRNKGVIVSDDVFNLNLNLASGFSFDSGTDVIPLTGLLETKEFTFPTTDIKRWTLVYEIVITGEGEINYEFTDLNTNQILDAQSNLSVDNETVTITLDFQAPLNTSKVFQPSLFIETLDPNVTEIDVLLEATLIQSGQANQVGNYSLFGGSQVAVSNVIIQDQIPPMKVINFLTSLFKMFNLTAYVKTDGSIFIEPLDVFYDEGNEYDITNQIDITESNVARLKPFSEVVFKYDESITQLIKERNVRTDSEYGNLSYKLEDNLNDNSQIYGGGTYNVNIEFDKMLYERLIASNGNLTRICYGRYVDDKGDPTFGKPLVFIAEKTTCTGTPIEFENSGNTVTSYIRPANAIPTQSINFGAELDEFTQQINNNSLFATYYYNYITRVFNPLSRLYDFNAYVDLNFVNKYKLNDTLIINNRKFNINDIEVELKTGKAKLKLINISAGVIDNTAGRPAPTPPARPFNVSAIDNGSGSVDVNWTDAEDDSRITGTVISLLQSGVVQHTQTESFGTETTNFTSVTAGTYDIEVQHRLSTGTLSGVRKGENTGQIVVA